MRQRRKPFSLDDLQPGDPVRIAGRRGHWRFVKWVPAGAASMVLVIGPFTRSRNPKFPNERLFDVIDVREPDRLVNRETVAMSADIRQLSHAAKSTRRG